VTLTLKKRKNLNASTWTDLLKKIRIIAIYLWPRDSRLLQLNALFCVLLVVTMRLTGLFVPIYASKISKYINSSTSSQLIGLHIFTDLSQ
jgi:hypothetical protein